MITVIDIGSRAQAPTAEGHVRNVLGQAETGTRVSVAVREVEPGKTYRVDAQRPNAGRLRARGQETRR